MTNDLSGAAKMGIVLSQTVGRVERLRQRVNRIKLDGDKSSPSYYEWQGELDAAERDLIQVKTLFDEMTK